VDLPDGRRMPLRIPQEQHTRVGRAYGARRPHGPNG
jgi:hypothetical protein